MAQVNQVSFNLSAEDLIEVKGLIDRLKGKLAPYLKTLSPDDRVEMLKMGDKTVAFVQKALEYCRQFPHLVPPYLNVDDFAVDVKAMEEIRSMYQLLLTLTEGLGDTMMLSGSEAFAAALIFYNAVKNAMKSKIPNAETIYNDLSARFPGRPKKMEVQTGA